MSSLNSHDPCLVLLCKRVAEAEAKLNATKSYFAEHRTAVLAEFTAAVDSKNLTTAQVIRDRFIVAIQDPDFDLILNRFVDPKEEVALAEAEKARKARVAELIEQLTSVLNMVHRLNQDANDLRMARDDIQGGAIKLA